MNLMCTAENSMERRILMAVMAGGVFFAILAVFKINPADIPFDACAFHSLTGHSCLTCGMTRSLHALSHGDLGVSIQYHLFGPVVFAGMLLCLAGFSAEAVGGRRMGIRISKTAKCWAIATLGFIWLAYWGVRILAECMR